MKKSLKIFTSIMTLLFAVTILSSCVSKAVTSVEFKTYEFKNVYLVGDTFDYDGMNAVFTYSDGSQNQVNLYDYRDEVVITGFDTSIVSESKEITVKYGKFKTAFFIRVVERNEMEEHYDVTFDTAGGSEMIVQSILKFGLVPEPLSAPTKDGFVFDGWYKEPTCTNRWNFATDKIIDHTTLFAKWAKEFTFTFIAEYEGQSLGTFYAKVKEGGTIVNIPAVPEVEGLSGNWDRSSFSGIMANATVYAKYTPKTFVVTFYVWDALSDKMEIADAVTVQYGKAVTPPVDTGSRDNYHFKAWDKITELESIKENLTVYALYEIDTHTVTFDFNYEGIENHLKEVAFGATIALTSLPEFVKTPVREGHFFDGWYVSSDENAKQWDFGYDIVRNPTTVYAKWSKAFNITFYKDVTGDQILQSFIVKKGGTFIALPAIFPKEGHIGQWSETIFQNVQADWEVRPEYTVLKFTVTFKGLNPLNPLETIILKEQTNIDWNTAATAPSLTEIAGYDANGWDRDFSAVRSDMEVSAKYTAKVYSVIYHANGGTNISGGNVDNKNISHNEAINEQFNVAVIRDGQYTFSGWYANPELTISFDFTASIYATSEINLYAKWTKYYIVTFENVAPGESSQIIVDEGRDIIKPPQWEQKVGMDGRWVVKNTQTPASFRNIRENFTVEPMYADKTFEVKVFDKDGELINFDGKSTITVIYGKNVKLEVEKAVNFDRDLKKEGHDFIGWSPSLDTPIYENNIEIRPQYTKSKYDVSFYELHMPNLGNVDGNRVLLYTYKVEHGDQAAFPASITMTQPSGYSITGWDRDMISTYILSNTEFVATYKIKEFTLRFFDDDNSLIKTITKEYKSKLAKTEEDILSPTKLGHVFRYWFIKGQDSDLTRYEEDTIYRDYEVIEDEIFRASYTIESYKVNFSYNHQTETQYFHTANVDYGYNVANPGEPKLGVDTEIFLGWFKNEEGTIRFNFNSDAITEETIIYAKWAGNLVSSGSLYFELSADGDTAALFGVKADAVDKEDDIIIGNYILINDKQYVITKIANGAFNGVKSKSITIQNGSNIQAIGANAFAYTPNLETFIIPATVNNIEASAFYNSGVENIIFAERNGATITFGDSVFANCYNLKEINIPEGVTSISPKMFLRANNIKVITLPASLQSIGTEAFKSAVKLNQIIIKSALAPDVGRETFMDCHKGLIIYVKDDAALSNFKISNRFSGHRIYTTNVRNGDWAYILDAQENKTRLLQYIGSKTEVLIPVEINGKQVILDNYVFDGNITRITYENKIKLSEKSFDGSISLKQIDYIGEPTDTDGLVMQQKICFENIFKNIDGLSVLRVPTSIALTKIFNSGVPSSIKKLIIYGQEGARVVVDRFVMAVNSIEKITIEDSVYEIGEWSFSGLSGLNELNIVGENLIKIKTSAFSGCVALSKMNIPYSVTEIGENAFDKVPYLSLENFSDGYVVLGNDILYKYIGNVVDVILPNNIKVIGNNAYADNTSIESFNTEANNSALTKILNNAFMGAINLKIANIPDSVTEVGANAFRNCLSLESVKLTKVSGFVISESMFENNIKLVMTEIPSNVQAIKENAFKNADSIKNLTIYNTLEEINDSAFENMDSLKYVVIKKIKNNVVIKIGALSFDNNSPVLRFYIEGEITDVDRYKNNWTEYSSKIYNHNIIDEASMYSFDTFGAGYKIVQYLGENTNVVVPTSHKSLPIVEMDSYVYDKTPTNLTFGSSVIINTATFELCINLQSLTFNISNPNDLTIRVGDDAHNSAVRNRKTTLFNFFSETAGNRNYPKLDTLKFNAIVKLSELFNEAGVANNPEYLKNIYVLPGTSELPENAFESAYAEYIFIDKSVVNINSSAFAFCRDLTKVEFGAESALKSIGNNAFQDCVKLETIVTKVQTNVLNAQKASNDYYDNSFPSGLSKIGMGILNGTKWDSDRINNEEVVIGDGVLYRLISNQSTIFLREEIKYIADKSMSTPNLCAVVINNGNFFVELANENVFGGEDVRRYLKIYVNNLSNSEFETNLVWKTLKPYNKNIIIDGWAMEDKTTHYDVLEYVGNDVEVVVPAMANGKPVKNILADAFNKTVTKITLQTDMSAVKSSFALVQSLTEIELKIMDGKNFVLSKELLRTLFLEKSATLKTLTVDGVIRLDDIFNDTTYANDMTALDEKNYVDLGATLNRPQYINTVKIKEGVTEIADEFAYNYTEIDNFVIPTTVKKVGFRAFASTGWYSKDFAGDYQIVGDGVLLRGKANLNNIVIPSSIKVIAPEAFKGNLLTTTIDFGDSAVVEIGSYAFSGMLRLDSISVPVSVNKLGRSVFFNSNALVSAEFKKAINDENMGINMFYGCLSLETVTVPTNMTLIQDGMFTNCENLRSFNFDNIEVIGERAFKGAGIDNVNLTNVEIIKDNAFENAKLTTISIPDTTKVIGYGAFMNSALVTVEISNFNTVLTQLSDYVFFNNISLQSVKFNDSITVIGEYAFAQTPLLSNVELSLNLNTIKDYAFKDSLKFNENEKNRLRFKGNNVNSVATTAIGNETFIFVPIDGFEHYTKLSGIKALYENIFPFNLENITSSQLVVAFIISNNTFLAPIAVTANTAFGKPENPIKLGYDFKGWTTDYSLDGNYDVIVGNDINESVFNLGIANHVKLFAVWEESEIDIIIDIQGGNAMAPTSGKVKYNHQFKMFGEGGVLLNSSNLIKTGNTLMGFFTEIGGSGVEIKADTINMFTNTTTIYAKWQTAITFDVTNGGSIIEGDRTLDVVFNKAIGTMTKVLREGYDFLGWFYNNTKIETGATYVYNTAITVQPRWEAKEVNVKYHFGAGTRDKNEMLLSNTTISKLFTYDQAITLPASTDYIKYGYLIESWHSSDNATDANKFNPGKLTSYQEIVDIYVKWVDATAKYLGDGSVAKPYRIYTANQFRNLAEQTDLSTVGVNYKLSDNINFKNGNTRTDISIICPASGKTFLDISVAFNNIFDGGKFTISGFRVNGGSAGDTFSGLFGIIGKSGVVKNLNISDFEVTGASSRGVGASKGGTHHGGIAGVNNGIIQDVTAKNGTVTGSAVGDTHHGGIVGYMYRIGAKVINAEVYDVQVTATTVGRITSHGGIAGSANNSLIQGCTVHTSSTSQIMISGKASGSSTQQFSFVGGIAGVNAGVIINCTTKNINMMATVSQNWAPYLGGIAGYLHMSSGSGNSYNESTFSENSIPISRNMGYSVNGATYNDAAIINGTVTGTLVFSTTGTARAAIMGRIVGRQESFGSLTPAITNPNTAGLTCATGANIGKTAGENQ